MIENATLISIQTPGAASTGGDPGTPSTQTLGVAGGTQGVRCFIGEPTRSQVLSLANRITDASGVIYVSKVNIPGISIVPMQILTTRIDGDAANSTMQVLWVRDRQMPGPLSHFEVFVKELA